MSQVLDKPHSFSTTISVVVPKLPLFSANLRHSKTFPNPIVNLFVPFFNRKNRKSSLVTSISLIISSLTFQAVNGKYSLDFVYN